MGPGFGSLSVVRVLGAMSSCARRPATDMPGPPECVGRLLSVNMPTTKALLAILAAAAAYPEVPRSEDNLRISEDALRGAQSMSICKTPIYVFYEGSSCC